MRVTIRRRNLELTPSLATYAEKKIIEPIQKLLKRIRDDELPILDVELARTTRHHRKGNVFHAEANLSLDGTMLRAEATAEDIRAACDLLEEELRRELTHYKTKRTAIEKRRARQVKKDVRLSRAARLYRKGRIREEGV